MHTENHLIHPELRPHTSVPNLIEMVHNLYGTQGNSVETEENAEHHCDASS
jgi:hypothetical protein